MSIKAHVFVSCVTKEPKDLPTITFQVPLNFRKIKFKKESLKTSKNTLFEYLVLV